MLDPGTPCSFALEGETHPEPEGAMDSIEINPALLWTLGYRHLTQRQVTDALHEIYEALELRVGQRLASRMNNRQLEDFDKLIGPGSYQSRALAWLDNAVPDYRTVVSEEFDSLRQRLENAVSMSRRARREIPGTATRGLTAGHRDEVAELESSPHEGETYDGDNKQ